MLFLDYSTTRRFVANPKVVILLLFFTVVINSSFYEDFNFDNDDSIAWFERSASKICEATYNTAVQTKHFVCSFACSKHKCDGNCTAISSRCLCYQPESQVLRCQLDCSNKRRFGCEKFCECKNDGSCNYTTGNCKCSYGWEGADCSKPCSTGYFGEKCMQRCECTNNASCDHKSGECICSPGYRGSYCEKRCPNGTHGDQCLDECKCQNDAICHHVDGTCECGPGWTGPVCADRCHDGRFGINCSEVCKCSEKSTCDIITGECVCEEAFYGRSCDINCLSEEWGKNRSLKCNYENAECASDEKLCLPGFHGSNCTYLDCHYNKWGDNCTQDCNCSNGGFCHPVTGKCCCKASWAGKDCSVSSEEYPSKQTREKAGVGTSVIVAAICIPAILVLVIVVSILFYKTRFVGERKGKGNSGLIKFSQLTNE